MRRSVVMGFNLTAAVAGLWLALACGGWVAAVTGTLAVLCAHAAFRAGGRAPALAAVALLCLLAPGPARADWHFGFGLFGSRQPKTVQLQSVVPTAACATCVTAPAAVTSVIATPAPALPVTLHMQAVQVAQPQSVIVQQAPAAVAPVPVAPAPVMLQVAPAQPPPDRYWLLRQDGQGNLFVSPCSPKP